jgi:hypothetical protein
MSPRLVSATILIPLLFGCSRSSPSDAADLQAKRDCADRAEAYLKRERDIDVPANGINGSVRSEQYKFSRSLNTCLLYFEVVEFEAGTTYNIVDTLTSKKLYYHVSYKDADTQRNFDAVCKPSDGCLGQDEFQKKRAELFDGAD